MRSYYAHLETAMGTKQPIAPRPTLRASAIFPVMRMPGVSSRILFMSYWMLKRNIAQIAAVITLRDTSGTVLNRSQMLINEPKTHRVELEDQLRACNFSSEDNFTGSLEIEFFSTVNLVFPFPAVVINYYGPKFSSVVHTAQRVFNDFDDMRNNTQTNVPESGFNVHVDKNVEPFIGIINGPEPVEDAVVKLEFINCDKETLVKELKLGRFEPYQMTMLYPARFLDLKNFLKGKAGAGKLHFHVNWIFPRLLAGNIDHSLPAVTLTHTYYDCSAATADSNYWKPAPEGWYPASLMIPGCVKTGEFTNIYFYPIYSPSKIAIDVEIHDASGKVLGQKKEAIRMELPSKEFKHIPVKELCEELGITPNQPLAVRLSARPLVDSRLPARIKVALDVGRNLPNMPCNICTNLQPYIAGLENKPSTFRWAPILADQPQASFWILNSSPEISYNKPAEVKLSFYREKDTHSITRTVVVPAKGFYIVDPAQDKELADFFEKQVGWCTAVSSNPYTSSYYFAINPSGVVGGDHGF